MKSTFLAVVGVLMCLCLSAGAQEKKAESLEDLVQWRLEWAQKVADAKGNPFALKDGKAKFSEELKAKQGLIYEGNAQLFRILTNEKTKQVTIHLGKSKYDILLIVKPSADSSDPTLSAILASEIIGNDIFVRGTLAKDGRWALEDAKLAKARSPELNLLRKKLATVARKDVPELRQGLKHPSREVRLVYIDAIGSLKEEGRDASSDLIPLVGNPDKGISLRAVLALDSMGKFVDVVRDNADANILSPALTALKSKGVKTEEELTAYEKHLQHPEGEVKRLAALALIQLAPARLQVDRLTDLMLTPNDEVRNAAGKLLRAKLGEKLANVTIKDLPMLREGLKNPVREFRLSFVDAIGSLKANGQEAALDLAGLLGGPDKDISIQASRALEGMGRAAEKAVPTLEKTIASVDRSVAVAATIAMGKIDPANPTLRNKGVNLLIEDLDPDVKDLKTLLAQPLNSRSIATILEIGEPTIDPLVTYLLTRNSPKMVAQNKQLEAVAARYLGYEILKEFATQAKAKQDKKLIVALKKHESSLRAFWEPQETTLGNQARKAFGLPPETAQLYTTAARSANQARLAISALRVP